MNKLFDKPYTFDRTVRLVVGLVIAAFIIYVLYVLRHVLLPFVIAWLLAYLIQPLVSFFQHKLHFKIRILAMLASFITVIAIIAGLVVIVTPSVVDESTRFMQVLHSYSFTNSQIPFIPQQWIDYLSANIDINQIREYLSVENVLNLLKQALPQAWSILSGTVSVLIGITVVFIVFLYFFFILLDYDKFANGWIKLFPEKRRQFVSELTNDVESSMNRYFRGQSLIAFCVGCLLAIGFKIIDFPLAILLGLFIGVLNLVPYLQTIGILPMLLLSWLKAEETGGNFWIIFAMSLLVLGVVQVIQDMILTPKIMGHQMGLNPAVILLSLSVWGSLLGFIGLIIALPLTTLCLSYYKRFVLGEMDSDRPNNDQKPAEQVSSEKIGDKKKD